MEWMQAHLTEVSCGIGALIAQLVSALGLLARFRAIVREEVLMVAPGKTDVARLEGKVDVLIDVIKTDVLNKP